MQVSKGRAHIGLNSGMAAAQNEVLDYTNYILFAKFLISSRAPIPIT